jgi:hypothetical protein
VLNDGGDGEGDPRVPVWRDYSAMLPISTGAAAFWSLEAGGCTHFESNCDP